MDPCRVIQHQLKKKLGPLIWVERVDTRLAESFCTFDIKNPLFPGDPPYTRATIGKAYWDDRIAPGHQIKMDVPATRSKIDELGDLEDLGRRHGCTLVEIHDNTSRLISGPNLGYHLHYACPISNGENAVELMAKILLGDMQ